MRDHLAGLSSAGRLGPRAALLALLTIVALVGDPTVTGARAAPLDQAVTTSTYRLVDTWSAEPWALTAGRIGSAIDISSAPDGTIYVLDGQNRAVHVLDRDGTPRAVFAVAGINTEDRWRPVRLDVGFDGRLYVLVDGYNLGPTTEGRYRMRVDRLSAAGEAQHSFELVAQLPQAYVDLAVRSDGRIYISRNGWGSPYIEWPIVTPTPIAPDRTDNAVEVFDANGMILESLAPPEMQMPGNLDVDRDGTIYVINRVPSPWSEPPPGATATPRPSFAAPQRVGQQVRPIEGVLIFAPDHAYRETVPFRNAEDIAAGPAGVFLSRSVEVFALRESQPLFTGPSGAIYAAYLGRVAFNLDVPVDGRLLASINHCYVQGVVIIDRPADRPAAGRYSGANDRPFLEGPPYPLRLAASEEVAILQGRYMGIGDPPYRGYLALTAAGDAQTVQRWTREGRPTGASRLRAQLGVCAGADAWWTRDVAIDGTDIYTVDPNLIQLRPDDGLPRWSISPVAWREAEAPSLLTAVAADGGRAAVLDRGAGAVIVLRRDGTLQREWALELGDENALPVDIALHGDRVYLADLGRSRVTVHDLDGHLLADWPTHDGPAAIAVGPTGDVFILGRGRWGFRYTPDGTLRAAWSMPDRGLQALDLGVDVDGRVYVSYLEPEMAGEDTLRRFVDFTILQAGVWVFEAAEAGPVTPPDPAACVASPDKWAQPRRLPLGDQVDVTLTVEGRCPPYYEPVQVVVLLDSSRSMTNSNALDRARDALAVVLGRLDPRAAEVALVTFEDGASLQAPLSRDIAAVSRLVVDQAAAGDTRLTAGLELARTELAPPRGDMAARRIILVASDGIFHDDPIVAADAAKADGIEVYGLILTTNEFEPTRLEYLQRLVSSYSHLFIDPEVFALTDLVDDMVRYHEETGLFEALTVEDEVPANMRYVDGSSIPRAEWDPTRRVLTWTLGRVFASRTVLLRYRVEPLEAGTWPTNVRAVASYRDIFANEGQLIFPVPEVTVYTYGQRIYLPFGAARSCLRRVKPLDVVLVMDTSSSMTEAAPGGGTKLDAARTAAGAFLDLLSWPADHAGLVSFDIGARRHSGLTGDRAALETALAGLTTGVGTHIDLGLAEARAVLVEGGRPGAKPVVILLSDGLNNDGRDPVLAAAGPLKDTGAVLYTIGLGADADAELLRQVATTPDRYHYSPTADELLGIYRQLIEWLACDTAR